MASVWRHPQSRYWTACFRDGRGRQRKISTKLTARKAAQQVADEYERASRMKRTRTHTRETIERLTAELLGEPSFSKVTLRDFTDSWLASKAPETAPSTRAIYRRNAAKLIAALGPERADQPMSEITKADLVRFRNGMAGLAPKTISLALKVTKMLFKAARADDVIPENPAEFVAGVRARPSVVRSTFSLPQLRAVLAVCDPEWRSMVLFGFYTGQRLGDLAKLRANSIDLPSGRLTLVTSKTGKRLTLPLAAPLKAHLEAVWTPGPFDEPLHPKACQIVEREGKSGTLSRQFGELLARAGLREKVRHVKRNDPRTLHALSFHSLRRTATTLLHEAGVPQAIAQAFIGHDSASVHEIYVAVGGEALEKAAAAFPNLLDLS